MVNAISEQSAAPPLPATTAVPAIDNRALSVANATLRR